MRLQRITDRPESLQPRQPVKKMCPERTIKYDHEIRIAMGHLQTVQYIAAILVSPAIKQIAPTYVEQVGAIHIP